MPTRHCPIAVKVYCDGAQQVRAARCHQRSVGISVNQRGNRCPSLCLGHSTNGVAAILDPKRGNGVCIAAVSKRTIGRNEVTDRLTILKRAEPLFNRWQRHITLRPAPLAQWRCRQRRA